MKEDLERLDFEIRNLPRHALEWEWMKVHPEGEYILREDVLQLLEKMLKKA